MARYNVDPLQDALLLDFQQAGMLDFATELGLIGEGNAAANPGHDLRALTLPLEISPLRLHHAGPSGAEVAAAAREALLQHSLKRAAQAEDPDAMYLDRSGPTPPHKKKRATLRTATLSAEKSSAGKGLRHFSLKVCEKVESKGRTTYNEVADELVAEYSASQYTGEQQFDEKNIRRRVYDALNVLMAMNIISKEKKDITWRGLPQGPDASTQALQADKTRIRLRVDKKNAHLAELVQQHAALEALLARNAAARREHSDPAAAQRIALPFILVQTQAGKPVEVSHSEDLQHVHMDFNDSQFSIHDDAYVLNALHLVPPVLHG